MSLSLIKKDFVEHLRQQADGKEVVSIFLQDESRDGEYGRFHENYGEYLDEAYRTRREIILSPDILWFTLLCEFARIVDANPESYRKKFTSQSKDEPDENENNPQVGKKLIEIETENSQDLTIYIGEIMYRLRSLVPAGLAYKILIDFSTKTRISTVAQHSVFADMVKHHYLYQGNQGNQGSQAPLPPPGGIAHVHMTGTAEDWRQIRGNWADLVGSSSDSPIKDKYAERYYSGVYHVLARLAEDDQSDQKFLLEIRTDDGGGWFKDLIAPSDMKGSSYNHIARVPYTAKYRDGRKEKFILVTGIFSCHLEGNTLHPEFGYLIMKVR